MYRCLCERQHTTLDADAPPLSVRFFWPLFAIFLRVYRFFVASPRALCPLRQHSYRRRIVAQRKKQVKDPGNEKRNELLVTLENKLVAAEANFKSVDVVLRREMQWVIDNKHNLVHKQMVMCMCCYSEFYKRANAEFVNVVQNIPEGKQHEDWY